MTDWLEVSRGAVDDLRGVLEELPTRDEREPVVGDGEGGDETTAVDAAAEKAILARLQQIDDTTIVSEEIGTVGDGATRIVLDRGAADGEPVRHSGRNKRPLTSFG